MTSPIYTHRIKENKLNLFCWLIYTLITFFAVINHEPNRDEAQVWLIVRDLDIISIYRELSAMGHPGLWYMILFPFAKLGFPYITMLIIHWLIGILSAGILLWKTKVEKSLKILFLFSYYMLFEYIVPARNYNLTILILFLIATYYPSRFKNPFQHAFLIFALYNVNTTSFGAAIGLTIIYLIEVRKSVQLKDVKYPIIIMLTGMFFFIFQMIPAFNQVSRNVTINASIIPPLNFNSFWVIVTGIQNAFIPVSSEYEELKIALFFTLIFLIFLIILLRNLYVFIFMISSSSWLFYIFSTKLSGSWRHEGLLLIFIIFSIWIKTYYSEEKSIILTKLSPYFDFYFFDLFIKKTLIICFVITSIFGFKSILKEYQYSYSGAEETANFIIKNHYDHMEIACYRSWRATALSPYLPKVKFWQIDREGYGTYFNLDSIFYKYGDNLNEKEVMEKTKKKFPNNSLLLLNERLTTIKAPNYTAKLLFENKKFIWGSDDEHFFLYSINSNEILSH